MDERDTIDLVTAFAVGALIGVGTMLLLRPEPEPRSVRAMRQIRRSGKELQKGAKRVGSDLADRAGSTAEMSLELVETGRKVASALRDEIADIVADARDDLGRALASEVKSARRELRKRAKELKRR